DRDPHPAAAVGVALRQDRQRVLARLAHQAHELRPLRAQPLRDPPPAVAALDVDLERLAAAGAGGVVPRAAQVHERAAARAVERLLARLVLDAPPARRAV